ncbi:hypothetical protein Tco_1322608 [Tanacetum coccineum]
MVFNTKRLDVLSVECNEYNAFMLVLVKDGCLREKIEGPANSRMQRIPIQKIVLFLLEQQGLLSSRLDALGKRN